jgi:hypothetical protein
LSGIGKIWLLLALLAVACERPRGAAAFHVGIVTGTVSQSEDEVRGAEALLRAYGSVARGGVVLHQTYPDDFMSQQETFISNVVSLADDPLMKAVVVNQSIPGTAEAFRRIHDRRPDILCFAGQPHEDPLVIAQAADCVVLDDFQARGYLIPWEARQMGAKTLVHVSFPRHMSYETLGRRRALMETACRELGLRFVFETAPDPTSDVGVAGAQQFILEKVPAWLAKYGARGERVALFCTNDAQVEPMLQRLLESRNGLFVEADLPSPLLGYPGVLGLDLTREAGQFPAILDKIDAAVVRRGGSGRFASWPVSFGFTLSAGLGEYAIHVLEGRASLKRMPDLFTAFGRWTPGARWSGGRYVDPATGVRVRNLDLVYMDAYVFGGLHGDHWLRGTEVPVPARYLGGRRGPEGLQPAPPG